MLVRAVSTSPFSWAIEPIKFRVEELPAVFSLPRLLFGNQGEPGLQLPRMDGLTVGAHASRQQRHGSEPVQ